MDYSGLASCYQAQFEVNTTGNYGGLMKLVRQHTLNIAWIEEIIADASKAKYPGVAHFVTEKDAWESEIRHTIDSKLHTIRQIQYQHTQERNLPALAAAYLEEGNIMVLQGEFRAAHQCYQQGRGTHSSMDYEGLIGMSGADMLQRHWSIVQTSLMKVLKLDTEPSRFVLQSYGLASWCLGDYGDCTSSFLQLEDLGGIPWISEETAAAILMISVLLSMSREDMRFFLRSDKVTVPLFKKYPAFYEFVSAYYSLDIAKTWSLLPALTDVISENYFAHGRLEASVSRLREQLHQHYLAVRRLTPLTSTLELFSLLKTCTVFDLADDAKRWGMAIEVDTVADTIEVKTEAPRLEMLERTAALSRKFIYDGTMLVWSRY